ncbi:hypothetical protein LJB88_02180 [Erysipelotrichaceae bacterium OttesenSCG-928-M19]|nr:hypothetical protein [Erysipelotrichaceae bacterium OttesenSCG-928-M19]
MKKIILLFILIIVAGCGKIQVDMSECSYLIFENIDGKGEIKNLILNKEELLKIDESLKKMKNEDLEFSIIDKEENGENKKLKNGDNITISIHYKGDDFRKYDFEGEFDYKVTGLKTLEGIWERQKDDSNFQGLKIKVIPTDNGYYGEIIYTTNYNEEVGFRKNEIKWKNIKKESANIYIYEEARSDGKYADARMKLSDNGDIIEIKLMQFKDTDNIETTGYIQEYKRVKD